MNDKKDPIGFSFAWNGIREVARTERNFQIHLAATLLIIIAGFIFQLTRLEWAILFLVIGLVLVAEITNSAIEKIMDHLKPELDPSAGVIKDIAAGAVLISAITAFVVGLIIFIPKLYVLL